MIARRATAFVHQSLAEAPAVCLLGPRQVGKTTLALDLAQTIHASYLDLESPSDLAKLDDPEAYLLRHLDHLVILDEVQCLPEIFQPLRGLIDRAVREGRGPGRYLLLGSAALDLLRQSSESLAGRLHFVELHPFHILEPTGADTLTLWLRGGFPRSLLASDDAASLRWRQNFIRTYLQRDIPQLGPRLPAETLRRLWTMLAHRQACPLNAAELARSLDADTRTVCRYLDLLADLFLLRRLPPWSANTGKRLLKSPRLYLRDSGLAHALLGIETLEQLLAHPIAGASWESFAIEQILQAAPAGAEAFYYRTSGGAEIDLLLRFPGGPLWAIEIKRTTAPNPSRGYHEACADLQPHRRIYAHAGAESFPLRHGIEAIPLPQLANELQK